MASVLIVTSDRDQYLEMAEMLLQAGYKSEQATGPDRLPANDLGRWLLLVVDLDDKGVDNRFFSELAKRNPGLAIIGFSHRKYHPNLKEAMSGCLGACLTKPVNGEEFVYLVKGLIRSGQSRNTNGGEGR